MCLITWQVYRYLVLVAYYVYCVVYIIYVILCHINYCKFHTSLGLYIESNVIKYAKVTKEREALRIESFGIKFYNKIGDALNQIISETFSYNIPISVNLSEEIYNYFHMFSLLNKNEVQTVMPHVCTGPCLMLKIGSPVTCHP